MEVVYSKLFIVLPLTFIMGYLPPGLGAPAAEKTVEQMVCLLKPAHFEPTDSFLQTVHSFLVCKSNSKIIKKY